MPVEYVYEVDKKSLARVLSALNREVDGKELKRDLLVKFAEAAEPVVEHVQAAILSMPSQGYTHESLRGAIADKVSYRAVLGGRQAGVVVRGGRTRVRGFWHSPKRTNRLVGWNHPVFGSPESPHAAVRARYADKSRWVHQTGAPGWFDRTVRIHRRAFQIAAVAAVNNMAERIARRSRR